MCECGDQTPTPVMDFALCGLSWTEKIDAWSTSTSVLDFILQCSIVPLLENFFESPT